MKSLTILVARDRPVNGIRIDYQGSIKGKRGGARSVMALRASRAFCFDFLNSVTGRSSEAGSIADAKCGRPSVRGTGVRATCS